MLHNCTDQQDDEYGDHSDGEHDDSPSVHSSQQGNRLSDGSSDEEGGGLRRRVPEPMRDDQILLQALSKQPFLAGCDPTLLGRLAAEAPCLVLDRRQELALASDQPMTVVVSGALLMAVGSGASTLAYPGTSLGVAGMLGGTESVTRRSSKDASRPASVRCVLDYVSPDGGEKEEREEDELDDFIPQYAETLKGSLDFQIRQTIESCLVHFCPHTLPASLDRDELVEKAGGSQQLLQLSVIDGMDALASRAGRKADRFRDHATIAQVSLELITEILRNTSSWDQFQQSRGLVLDRFGTLIELGSLACMPADVVWALACVGDTRTLEEGHVVCKEGELADENDCLIVVQSGVLQASKLLCMERDFQAKDRAIAHLFPGAIVGDICFLQSAVPRSATLTVVQQEAKLIYLPAKPLLDVFAQFPGAASAFASRVRESVAVLQRSLGTTVTLTNAKMFSDLDACFIRAVANISERRVHFLGDLVKSSEECTQDTSVLRIQEFGLLRVEQGNGECVGITEVGTVLGERLFFGMPPSVTHPGAQQFRVGTMIAIMLCIARKHFDRILDAHPFEAKIFAALKNTDAGYELRDHHISTLVFLKGCSKSLIDSIASFVTRRSYLPGQTIMVQKSIDGGSLFILVSGKAEVIVNGTVLKEVGPGSSLGELCLLGLVRSRAATVTTTTFCVCMEVQRPRFLQALEDHPNEKEHFELLTKQHVEATENPSWSIFLKDNERLVYFVNLHARRESTPEGAWTTTDGEPLPEDAAVLVIQGEIARIRADKTEDVFTPGYCFGEEHLLGLPPPPGGYRLEPRTVCEVQIITHEIFKKILEDLPDAQEDVYRQIRAEMAVKCESRLGIPRGSPGVLNFSAVFRACSQQFMRLVRSKLQPMLCQPGEVIMQKGEMGSNMMILIRGRCLQDVEGPGDEAPVRLRQGTVLAESVALGFSLLYPSTVRTVGLCLFQTLDRDRLKDVLAVPAFERERQLLGNYLQGTTADLVNHMTASLRQFPLFSRASRSFCSMVSRGADEVYFAPDEDILKRSATCKLGETPMYVLLAGKAIVKPEFGDELATLKPGSLIGEGGALGLAAFRTATVTTWADGLVRCLRLQGVSLQRACAEFPKDYETLKNFFMKRSEANAAFETARNDWLVNIVVPALLKCRIFQNFSWKLVYKIAEPLIKSTFSAGKTICAAGDPASSMIVLLEGRAELTSKEREVVGILNAGGAVGEVAALGLFPMRTATVRASCKSSTVSIEAKHLWKMLSHYPAGRQALERLAEERRSQIARGMPIMSLPLHGCSSEDVVVRAVALHSDRILLGIGKMWTLPPDTQTSGPHYWIFARGKAGLVVGPPEHPVNPIFTFRPGTGGLCPEALCVEHDARVCALTPVEAFRISLSDLLLAAHATPCAWFRRFEKLQKEVWNHLRSKIISAKAVVDMGRQLEKSKSQGSLRKSQSTMPPLASSKSHVSLTSSSKISNEPKEESSSRPNTSGLLPTLQSTAAGLPASPSQTKSSGASWHDGPSAAPRNVQRKVLPSVSHVHLT